MTIINKIKCLLNRHKFTFIENISDQAALIKCSRCNKIFIIKFKGDFMGNMLPWTESTRRFYKNFFGYKGEL